MAVADDKTVQRRLRMDADRVGMAVVLALCYLACGAAWAGVGFPILAVDDGYVHLALAEALRSGSWGIGGDPTAAGSSSILWPWLLAPFADGGPAGEVWAQGLACIFVTLAQGLGGRLLREAGWAAVPASCASVLVLICAGAPAHAAAGMEHGAHAAATLAGLIVLHRIWRRGSVSWRLLAFAASAPLWRYEGLALFGLLLGALVLARHARVALVVLAGVAAFAGANAGVALAHGAPVLPVSLMDRGALAGGPDLAGLLADPWARPALAAGLALAALGALTRNRLALAGLALVVAHALAGEFGERGRLDFYITASAPLTALAVAMPLQRHLRRPRPIALAGVLALAALCKSHLIAVLETGAAARDLSQTALAARVVADALAAPVGSDGMGLMAYGARKPVVDLAGWGTPAPRAALRAGRWATWADSAMAQAGARAAFLSATQAPAPPAHWRAVGLIARDGPQRSSSSGPIRVWATDVAHCAAIARAAATLGSHADWRPEGCTPPSSPVHQ